MKRIGIIGTDNGHAHMYTALVNGWREDEPLPLRNGGRDPDPAVHIWGQFVQQLGLGGSGGHPRNIRVTRIWSDDPAEADRIARACDVDHVAATPEDAVVDVDAVMVLSEDPTVHFGHARPALERGLPTYIDKPMAPTSDEAAAVFAFADAHRAPCFTGSSLRYSPELLAARDTQQRLLGDVRAVYIHCPISIPLYVSHSLEMMNLYVGHDIEWVQAIEASERQVVLLQEASSISVVLDHVHVGSDPRYSGSIHGRDAYLSFAMRDLGQTAFAFVKAFADFAHTGVPPSPRMDSIVIMRLREAILRSLESGGRRVALG